MFGVLCGGLTRVRLAVERRAVSIQPPARLFAAGTVSTVPSLLRLEEITPENVDAACLLRVKPDQEKLVAPVARSLAEAYAQPQIAWPRLIFDGEQLVGFVMGFFRVHFDADPADTFRSGIWRLNIAADQQHRGYGRFAVLAVCDEIRERGQSRATVTWAPGDHGPERFYLQLGFHLTGEKIEDQVVGALDLPRP